MKKDKPLEGMEFEFEQYKCRRCGRMFFIQSKDADDFKEKDVYWEPISPCCKPYKPRYTGIITNEDGLAEPTGMHIRQIKLKVVEITYEIGLVARRRQAAESGKEAYPDPKEEEDE